MIKDNVKNDTNYQVEDEFNDVIVEGIKKLRNDLDITQDELGEKIGLSGSYVTRWENKQYKVSLKNLMLICDKCNCSLDYIFQRDNIIEKEIKTAKQAYEHIFNIEFPLIEEKDVDPMVSLNITTNKYLLKYFYLRKLLEQKKEQNQITQEVFDFELKELEEKYEKVFSAEVLEKVTYNCTRTDEN